jgi:hypothetical protein
MFVFPYIKDGERKTSGYCYCIRKNVLVVVTRRTYYYISWHVILIADRVHWLSWRRHVDRRETRMLAMNRYPTLRHFLFLKIFSFFFFFFTWNKHEKVTEGHLNSRPLWFFFPSSSCFILPLVCCCSVSFLRTFATMIIRHFLFFWRKNYTFWHL